MAPPARTIPHKVVKGSTGVKDRAEEQFLVSVEDMLLGVELSGLSGCGAVVTPVKIPWPFIYQPTIIIKIPLKTLINSPNLPTLRKWFKF